METVRCEWCGQGATDEYPVWGHKEYGDSPYVVSHQTRSYCTWAALARAEAAEADRDDAVAVELSDVLILLGLDPNEFELDQMRGVTHGVIDAMRQRNDALAARVAELESQIAAQGWRPVTEKPDKPGWYVVYDSDGHVFYNADIFPYRVARWTGKWDSAFNGLVDYWRPLPPAPQETTP